LAFIAAEPYAGVAFLALVFFTGIGSAITTPPFLKGNFLAAPAAAEPIPPPTIPPSGPRADPARAPSGPRTLPRKSPKFELDAFVVESSFT